jgi:hypothetical protein
MKQETSRTERVQLSFIWRRNEDLPGKG